ncbi:hypothetical protein [Acidiphilium acidophilum]|uniref:hypothetical protein n=1 Tax=Acidiphilium acidophilum TaxID=76588 RepID=UPI002E8E71B7|nr:hypothetical protein [Acidiphilium acidophilum]
MRVAPGDFEIAHRAGGAFAQIAGIGWLEGVAQAGEELEQRRGGGEQRGGADGEGFGSAAPWWWGGVVVAASVAAAVDSPRRRVGVGVAGWDAARPARGG